MSDEIAPTTAVASENLTPLPTEPLPVEPASQEVVTPPEEPVIAGEPAPTEPVQAVVPQPQDERLKGALDAVEKTNADLAKAIQLQASLVEKNPDLIHEIASVDFQMANRVIEKLWGEQFGIKTYKQLQERLKLEELKEKNPDAYESKKELSEIKEKLERSEEKARKATLEKFCEKQKIKNNAYDPEFQKVQKALESLNPNLVSDDYETALELAHKLAFTQSVVDPNPLPPAVDYNSGKPTVLPAQKQPQSSQTTWLAESLRKQGYKMEGL